MKNVDIIIDEIKRGVLDCNNQEPFFKILIKGLIQSLNKEMKVRNLPVPHIVLNTGDDLMYLYMKGQNNAIEPYDISNEDYVYNIVPRCIVNLGALDLLPDQVTNPYSRGIFQLQNDDYLYSLSAECRRLPVKVSVELKYYLDTYTDLLEIIQHTLSKLTYIRTYNIVYMGQDIICSYKIPENFSGEHISEITGDSQENRCKILTLNIELETNFPVFANATVIPTDYVISNLTKPGGNSIDPGPDDPNEDIEEDSKGALGFALYGTWKLGEIDPETNRPYPPSDIIKRKGIVKKNEEE